MAPEAHRARRTVLQRPQVSRTSDAAPPLQKSLFFGAVFIEAETFGQKGEQIVSDGGPACQERPVGTFEQLYRANTYRYVTNIRYGGGCSSQCFVRPAQINSTEVDGIREENSRSSAPQPTWGTSRPVSNPRTSSQRAIPCSSVSGSPQNATRTNIGACKSIPWEETAIREDNRASSASQPTWGASRALPGPRKSAQRA